MRGYIRACDAQMESSFDVRPDPEAVRYADFSRNELAKSQREIFRVRMSGFSIIVKRLK